MLIRDLDHGDEDIQNLKRLLDLDLTPNQKFLVESELRRLRGKLVETVTPTQILDFYCSDASKWAVLHNLKLKSDKGIQRIDHLVISRFFDVVLINCSCFYHDLKISVEGEYKLFDGRDYQPIVSPARKCRQQLQMLSEVFSEKVLAPSRVGVPLRPTLLAVILVSPSRNIIRPPASVLDTRTVIAANQFIHKLLRHRLNSRSKSAKMGKLIRYCSRGTLKRIARELAAMHESACVDFAAEIGLDPAVCAPIPPEDEATSPDRNSGSERSLQNKSRKSDAEPAIQGFGGAA